MPKMYKMTDITLELRSAGISPYTRDSLLRLERQGKLSFPKDASGDRVLTDGMLKDLIRAMSPGGEGEWHFNPNVEYDEK